MSARFFCSTWPFYHIKLPSGTHVRFEHGEVELPDEVAAELRKHMYYGSMITENVSIPWAASLMEGGDGVAESQREVKGQEEEEEEIELSSVLSDAGQEPDFDAPEERPRKPKPKRRK